MKLTYEINDFIFNINEQTKIEYINIKQYVIIFIVNINKNDIQMLIIDKSENQFQIEKIENRNGILIIHYLSDTITKFNHVLVLTKILFWDSQGITIDFMSDKNNMTYYIEDLQNLLTKFKSKKIAQTLLFSDLELYENLKKQKNIDIEYIQMVNPVISEENSEEDFYKSSEDSEENSLIE